MIPALRTKVLLISGVCLLCLFGLVGFEKGDGGKTRLYRPRDWKQIHTELWKNFRERLRLGLDLRGGMHLIL